MSDNSKIQEKYLEEFVYGAIDGIVTTFAIVSSVVGAGLNPSIVLVLGLANLFADGFSMGSSSYLSSVSAQDLAVKNGEPVSVNPLRNGVATFLSFIIVGGVSLIPFLIAVFIPDFSDKAFAWSAVLTGVAFVVVGIVKAKITQTNIGKSAVSILFIGAIASAIAYFVGYFLQGLA
jgi:VIT1/CCC1 family predicted Fe2+/Mn2+ transporter